MSDNSRLREPRLLLEKRDDERRMVRSSAVDFCDGLGVEGLLLETVRALTLRTISRLPNSVECKEIE